MANRSIKQFFRYLCILLILATFTIVASGAGFIAYLDYFAKTPAQPSATPIEISEKTTQTPAKSAQIFSNMSAHLPEQEVLITIRPGEGLKHIAQTLEDASIITNPYLFMIFTRYKGYNRKIQAGEYALSGRYSPEKILEMLISGKVKLHRLTIPEGLNIREIADVVEEAGFGNSEDFIKLATDRTFIRALGINQSSDTIPINSLEGYLFPETYLFPAGTDQKKIIKSMVEKFNKVFTTKWRDVCKQSGFSAHEIVILASMIEKETANSGERGMISSVFHNRLQKGMRLESDPTVIYGIPDFNGNITKKDLLATTPYNTYAIYGLPAGPIANPGKLSLQAAIFPEKSDFIFFVSRNDTTHQFSKTLKEHNMAVRRYQLNK